jgi:hypothetical protein
LLLVLVALILCLPLIIVRSYKSLLIHKSARQFLGHTCIVINRCLLQHAFILLSVWLLRTACPFLCAITFQGHNYATGSTGCHWLHWLPLAPLAATGSTGSHWLHWLHLATTSVFIFHCVVINFSFRYFLLIFKSLFEIDCYFALLLTYVLLEKALLNLHWLVLLLQGPTFKL